MYDKNHNINDTGKELKDVFGAYLVEGAEFTGYYDMPVINVQFKEIPQKLIPYSSLYGKSDCSEAICHFYENDYIFDGKHGVWNSLIQGHGFARGFNFGKLAEVKAVISPDYSLFQDMPRCMQIWNVYRSRVVCYYLNKIGKICIPNVRWTDKESYSFTFDGVAKGCSVAVGTLGCSKSLDDKKLLISGFEETISRIQPYNIIIYGSLSKEIKELLEFYNQEYYYFPSKTSLAFKEVKNGIKS